MSRIHASLASLAIVFVAANLRADTQLLVTGFPTEYTPGTPFTFDVRVGGVPGPGALLSYTVNLDLGTADPAQLLVEVNKPTDLSTFVLGDGNSILLAAQGLGTNALNVSFTGSQLALPGDPPPQPVDVIVGQNDILASITVTPGASLTGPITIRFNRQETSFDTGGEALTFSVQDALTAQQGEVVTTPVPTPGAWMLMTSGLGLLAVRRRLAGRIS